MRVWMIMFSPVWSITSKSGPADVCRGRLWTEFLRISSLNRTKTTEISFRVLIKDSLISDSPSSLHLRRLVRVWRSDSRPAAAPLHSDPVCTKTINQPAPEETPTVSEVLELIFLFLRSFIHSFGKMVHSGPIWEPELCNEVDFFCRFFIVEIFFNPKSKCYYLFIACYKLMYFLIYSQSKNLLSSSLWSSEILTARAKNLVKSKSSLNKRQAYWEYSLSFKLCFDFHQFGEICGRNICCAARWAGSTCGFIHLHLETKQVEAVTLNHSRTASVALKETLTCKKLPG